MNIHTMLRMIFLVVFVGWLVVWVLLPTKAYDLKWSIKLDSKLNTSYFGQQGTNLVLFSTPMMLLAAFGSVYLHFHNKLIAPRARSDATFLKQPVLVMAPLGIVTASELIFSSMFITLLIWSFANYLYVSFSHPMHMMHMGDKMWQAKFRSVSLRLGYVGNICWALLFFPVTRGSSLLPLVGLTSESSIKYHIWLGHISNFLFLVHTVGFIIYWAMTGQMAEILEWSKTWVSNVAGVIAIAIAIPMWVTSFPYFRRKMFEVFFYTHHLYLLYIVFYVLHVGDFYFRMILPGIFLFAIDRYLRYLQSWRHARLLSARILSCGAVELNFSKAPGLHYNPTSILFINVPRISKLQWHPFTVTSNCNMEPDKLSIVIKSEGTWSQKLHRELSNSLVDYLEVSTEGPYGPNPSNFLRHELLVMVSGGSGITPFISIIREIIFKSKKPNCRVPKVVLICAFKHSSELSMLDLLLPTSSDPAEIARIPLQIKAYVTQEKQQLTTSTRKPLQTIWFKPNPMDSPISAALGTNNWLWLGVIILSSFLMFLLLLGIVTRYYIFPVDHNTGEIYHFSYRALWDMFLCCVCVFVVSSLVFLWRRKKSVQIQNTESPTPTSSLGPCLYGADKEFEVESLPRESLVLATEVHYGSRPNLKKILMDCEERDVGVLVCGPGEMRHEVVRICSSGLAKNLHFEAISFNW